MLSHSVTKTKEINSAKEEKSLNIKFASDWEHVTLDTSCARHVMCHLRLCLFFKRESTRSSVGG